MTRKHYAIAVGIVRDVSRLSADFGPESVALLGHVRAVLIASFCTFFAEDNPSFDKARFTEACMGSPTKGPKRPKGKQ